MLRLLPHLDADGPSQMALDEALLETAAVTTLRTYRFVPATVSIGCFQDYNTVAASLPAPMPMVRRITGGGAIWHEHEVTWSLIGELGRDGLPELTRDCYPLLHAAIARQLATAAPDLGRQTRSVGDRRYRDEVRCFASPAADDLVRGAAKVLGSAARTRGQRVLLHGSLKLASNPWDGEVTAGCGLDADSAQSVLLSALPAALGQTVYDCEIAVAELAARDRLRQARYGDEAWLCRREGLRP